MSNIIHVLAENVREIEVNGVSINVPHNGIVKLRCNPTSKEIRFIHVEADKNQELNGDEACMTYNGNKLGAIKAHRARTGMSLMDSKRLVDAYADSVEKDKNVKY